MLINRSCTSHDQAGPADEEDEDDATLDDDDDESMSVHAVPLYTVAQSLTLTSSTVGL